MSETTTLNGATAVAEPSTETQSPPSDVDNAAVSALEQEQQAVIEETEESTPEPAPEPLTHAELQAKIDTGDPLTSDEKEQYRRFEQAEADRQRARQQARQRAEQNESTLREGRAKFHTDLRDIVSTIDTSSPEGQELLSTRLQERAERYLRDARPNVLHGEIENLRGAISQLSTDPELVDPTLGFEDLLKNWTQVVWDAGRDSERTGSDAGKLKTENARLVAENKRLSGLLAGKGAPPSTEGAKSVSSGGLTWERWNSMKPEEREEYRSEHPAEVNAMTRRVMGR